MMHYLVILTLALYGAFFKGAAMMKLTRHALMVEEFDKKTLHNDHSLTGLNRRY